MARCLLMIVIPLVNVKLTSVRGLLMWRRFRAATGIQGVSVMGGCCRLVITLEVSARWGVGVGIVSVSAGYLHTVGLLIGGRIIAAGDLDSGVCDAAAIDMSSNYRVGLLIDCYVMAAGDNSFGQCDVGDWEDIVAVAAGVGRRWGLVQTVEL